MSLSQKSPIARLVLFMICLAIAGILVATIHYAVADLPAHQTIQAPENNNNPDSCLAQCSAANVACIDRQLSDPGIICTPVNCQGYCNRK